METPTRYLAPFGPKTAPHYFADVVIIGGGLAGLRAAIAIDSRLSVLVLTKDSIDQSNSQYAQGGIAGVLDPEDCFEDHIADTLTAGGSLCDRQAVERVVREGPDRIRELVEWGTRFDQRGGSLVLGREGGHCRPRVVHALGDATGKEVMRAVIEWVRRLRNVEIWEDTFALDLLVHEGALSGRADFPKAARQNASLGQADDSLHGRGGPDLPRVDQSSGGDGGRPRAGLPRRRRTARHGVHAVPPHGALHRGRQLAA